VGNQFAVPHFWSRRMGTSAFCHPKCGAVSGRHRATMPKPERQCSYKYHSGSSRSPGLECWHVPAMWGHHCGRDRRRRLWIRLAATWPASPMADGQWFECIRDWGRCMCCGRPGPATRTNRARRCGVEEFSSRRSGTAGRAQKWFHTVVWHWAAVTLPPRAGSGPARPSGIMQNGRLVEGMKGASAAERDKKKKWRS
jgi:hypothetical protein